MNFEQLVELANKTEKVSVEDGRLFGFRFVKIIINDFKGFDDNYDKIIATKEELKDALKLVELIKIYGKELDEIFFKTYFFDKYHFTIHWASMEN